MTEFKLHSRGENWFHFRKNIGSMIESFSIMYCHDGTVCMTGDYGILCWRRSYNYNDTPDYGFPNEKTYINYFAEKVVRAEEAQKIKTWKKGLARSQMLEAIEEYKYEGDKESLEKLEFVLNELDYSEDGEYGYIQMLEAFNDGPSPIESEYFCEFGRTYTDMFRMRFEMVQSVSKLILEATQPSVEDEKVIIAKTEEKLDELFIEAFDTNDPAMLDWVRIKMELRRLRIIEENLIKGNIK